MKELIIKEFAEVITKVINKENLSRAEAYDAFSLVFENKTTEIQQGALLAALAAKGETKEEIAGCWEAICNLDTVNVTTSLEAPILDNCGTGMDSFKTFNISTCASIVAASNNIPIARHGARALTSICGTVDIAEAFGVDVECKPETVIKSLEKCNLALFNGMSPNIHPNALGRILSQMSFGSILNIAASLANPIKPKYGVRGVYSKEIILPVIEVMKEIGYKRAIVFNGQIDGSNLVMDEASVVGTTYYAELLENGNIKEYSLRAEDLGLNTYSTENLAPLNNIESECKSVISILRDDENGVRKDTVILNAALIFYIYGTCDSIKDGVLKAKKIIQSGEAYNTLNKWVTSQNTSPEVGLMKLAQLSSN